MTPKKRRILSRWLPGTLFGAALLSAVSVPVSAGTPASKKLDTLRKRLPTKDVPIENPCATGAGTCSRRALDRTLAKLAKLQGGGEGRVRFLHLGDSHVASDYITGKIRADLQAKFGSGGRGFVVVDQPWEYGGRRKRRTDAEWERDRIVDTDRAGRPFGFSGMSIESKKKGALATFQLLPEDQKVFVYYQAQPGGGAIEARVAHQALAKIETSAAAFESRVAELNLAQEQPGAKGKGRPAKAVLELSAAAPKARLYGISFERLGPGLLYDSIGPVGADARVYLDLDRKSFTEHLKALRPDVLVLMVGGNDALKVRKSWTTLEKVKKDHEDLIDVLRSTLPEADCLVWSPMDAGEKRGGKVVSRGLLGEVRDLQRAVATQKGCAFWDFYEAMGGSESIAAWAKAGVMNQDLVHPKQAGADLLGALFVESFERLYEASRTTK